MEGRRQMDAQRGGAAGKSRDGRHIAAASVQRAEACKYVGE